MEYLPDFPRTIGEFDERFHSDEACRAYLFGARWPDGWQCPRCGRAGGWLNRRGRVQCPDCGYQCSVTAGTVFHATKKSLRLWFKAIFLMMTQRNGVSARSLSEMLGVRYPTAWTWLHKLRRVLFRREHAPLEGPVEADETYWGGYRPGEQGRRKGGGSKDLVLVAVEDRGASAGRVRLSVLPDHTGKSIAGNLERDVSAGSEVHTDGLASYRTLSARGFVHRPTVLGGKDRSRASRELPHVHIVIGLLKRWLLGTHQGAVRTRHLPAYLEEFEFRHNRRRAKQRTRLFQAVVRLALGRRADRYRDIIGGFLASATPQPVGAT